MKTTQKERPLNHFLALSGICSRRHAVEEIKNGFVTIDDEVILEPSKRVTAEQVVKYKNVKVELSNRDTITIMLNKPADYECSQPTIHATKTVFDLVQYPDRRLFTIGRLDKNSEGMLLLSDDGQLAQKLTHPSSQIKKIYALTTKYKLREEDAFTMEAGIEDEGEFLHADYVEPIDVRRHLYYVTLTEGKKREIRRLVRAVGNRVERLERLQIGGLKMGDLRQGDYMELTTEQLAELFDQ